MLIILPKSRRFITAVEGDGSNLTDGDIADGFRDYLLTALYKQDGCELELVDDGQLLSKDMVKDLDIDELARRLLDYWEAGEEECILVEEKR